MLDLLDFLDLAKNCLGDIRQDKQIMVRFLKDNAG